MTQPMPVNEVFTAAGGIVRLARAIGVHHTTPRDWTRVPAERVFAVAKATGLAPHELRPDLFPKPEGA